MPETSDITMSKKYERFEQLDGLRGLCSLCVLLTHVIYGPNWIVHNPELFPPFFLRVIASFAHLSVLIFFVLSGFVIGYTTPKKFTNEEGKKYLLRRIIRIYPIYLIVVFISFIISKDAYTVNSVIGHLFFLQGWLVPIIPENLSLWSLQLEFSFYLIFLVIWKFNINQSLAITICIVSAILSAYYDLYILKILGYLGIWLSGFWLSRHLAVVNKSKDRVDLSFRFWLSVILITGFESENIFKLIVNKYALPCERPPIISDLILIFLLNGIIAATLGFKFPVHKTYTFSCILVFLCSSVAVAFGYRNGFSINLVSHENYSLAAFFLLLLPSVFLLRFVSLDFLLKLRGVGNLSYALYVVHYPVLCLVYRQPYQYNNDSRSIYFILSGVSVIMISLVIAWFLECIIHPIISIRLKTKFGLR